MRPPTIPAMSTPLDESRILADDLRHCSVLRLYRLAPLLGTIGAIVTAGANGWNPLTTTGASRCLRLALAATWSAVLVATRGRD